MPRGAKVRPARRVRAGGGGPEVGCTGPPAPRAQDLSGGPAAQEDRPGPMAHYPANAGQASPENTACVLNWIRKPVFQTP